jgi:hypothetical protein
VFDFRGRFYRLELGILDDDLFTEGFVEGDVDVFVDSRGDQEAGMFAVVGRQVGAAAA